MPIPSIHLWVNIRVCLLSRGASVYIIRSNSYEVFMYDLLTSVLFYDLLDASYRLVSRDYHRRETIKHMSKHTAIAVALYQGGFSELDRYQAPKTVEYQPSTEWLSETSRDIDMGAQGIIAQVQDVFQQQLPLLGVALFALVSYGLLIGWFLN
jgi:hypothetical protein